ncbi:Protein of unknown function [Cotesia congregata]|uniref:Uncharacterized protein n=1 Tax=Cotesia congregata TaxID=51543 RepID=A0A8J2MNL8_COTCN|nr:Protein of unknown function [Cotesia congregata]
MEQQARQARELQEQRVPEKKGNNKNDMSLIRKLVDCLQEVKAIDYTDTSKAQVRLNKNKAENALNLIYQIGLKEETFTTEEKGIIGNLLADTIEYLQVNIENTANVYRTRLSNSVLRKRSAVQFLLDNYSQFPVGNSTLADKFREVNIEESVEILDDIIDKWHDMTDSDEDSSDRESAGANEVPESHTWWSL